MTNVAAWQEFGTSRGIPKRPFFRNANAKNIPIIRKYISDNVKPLALPEELLARQVGLMHQDAVQDEIRILRQPPNSPITVALKGSSNPLIDTGFMRQSVTFKVTYD